MFKYQLACKTKKRKKENFIVNKIFHQIIYFQNKKKLTFIIFDLEQSSHSICCLVNGFVFVSIDMMAPPVICINTNFIAIVVFCNWN